MEGMWRVKGLKLPVREYSKLPRVESPRKPGWPYSVWGRGSAAQAVLKLLLS